MAEIFIGGVVMKPFYIIDFDYIPTHYEMRDWEFVCKHPITEIEEIEVTQFYGETDTSYTTHIEVCSECGEEV